MKGNLSFQLGYIREIHPHCAKACTAGVDLGSNLSAYHEASS